MTGGAGFIGSALVRRLIADTAATIVNVDKVTYAGNLESLGAALDSPRHHLARIDVADAAALRVLFESHRPDAVIHLAAESHVDRSIDSPAEFIHTNVVGTYALLQASLGHWRQLDEAARNAFRFVHVSTDEVFGPLDVSGSFAEDSPYSPTSPYAASKAGADHLVRAWQRTYRLPTIVTVSTNNYGPCQFPEKLIPLTIWRALRGEPILLYGSGEQVRDWLYVEDHLTALQLILARGVPGQTYAIGARNERRNLDVVRAVCMVLDELHPGGPQPSVELIVRTTDRPGHDFRYAIDPGRLESELGWRPLADFDSALRQTVQWYLDHPEWLERAMNGAYRGERLGLGSGAA